MSGGAIALGSCYVCHEICEFNPVRVPSFQGEPICETCIKLVNDKRRELGLPQFEIYHDSYTLAEAGQL